MISSLACALWLTPLGAVPEPFADPQIAHRVIHAPAVLAEHGVGHGFAPSASRAMPSTHLDGRGGGRHTACQVLFDVPLLRSSMLRPRRSPWIIAGLLPS